MAESMPIGAIAPWFGGKRTLAADIVAALGPHTQYFEPFCGSLAVLLAKPTSRQETVNDLHGDLINLARVIADQDAAPLLYSRLVGAVVSEDLLERSRHYLTSELYALDLSYSEGVIYQQAINRAYWYFVASWMGRNGLAGMDRVEFHLAVRWTAGGGSPAIRFRSAVESLPAWHRRLANVVILNRDAFEIIDRFEDAAHTAMYVDPPYPDESRSKGAYLHDFEAESDLFRTDDHTRLATLLRQFRHARVVVSSYDCERVRRLYDGWTFIAKPGTKNLHQQGGRGSRKSEAPEVLIVNSDQPTKK